MDSGYDRDDQPIPHSEGPYDRRLRAADADRQAAAARLRQHYTEGRLDEGEYSERLEQCSAAKTLGELDALFTDLPRGAAPLSAPDTRRPDVTRRSWQPVAWAPLVIAFLVIVVLTHGGRHFWFPWPLLFVLFFWWRPWGRGYGSRRGRRGGGTYV